MRKKTLLKIERDLKKRAKRMHLGKERTGAYVYGTLRKIRGNPRRRSAQRDIWHLRTKEEVRQLIERKLRKGFVVEKVEEINGMYRVRIYMPPPSVRFVWGESMEEYAQRAFPKIMSNPSTPQVDPPWNYGIYAGTGRGVIRKKGIETKIERLRKIVSERQNAVVQGVRVDLYSASAIVSVYDKLNPENQRKFLKMSVPKMADVAFKIINARELKPNPPRAIRKLLANGGKMKTWKLGEYATGGIIQAKISQSKNAVGIRVADYSTNETISVQLFRWPMDRFNLEVYLNDLTTSYYAGKILDWISASTGVGRGLQNATRYESGV